MHIADPFISPAVGLTMCAVSTAAIVYSVAKVKKDELCEKRVPVIGMMSALVFAVQMLNFTIPGTGSSGHIIGGILLAAMIGGYSAMLAMSAVLVVQCLFFADGGLLALGCNIFNVGVIPCLIVYPLICKPLMKQGRVAIASVAAVVIGLQLGAFGVVLQTFLSGVAELPFTIFLSSMLPIHLAIGLIEGAATAAVLYFVMRPETMESVFVKSGISLKTAFAMLAVITLIIGASLSPIASSNPDGLEWAIERTAETVKN